MGSSGPTLVDYICEICKQKTVSNCYHPCRTLEGKYMWVIAIDIHGNCDPQHIQGYFSMNVLVAS